MAKITILTVTVIVITVIFYHQNIRNSTCVTYTNIHLLAPYKDRITMISNRTMLNKCCGLLQKYLPKVNYVSLTPILIILYQLIHMYGIAI